MLSGYACSTLSSTALKVALGRMTAFIFAGSAMPAEGTCEGAWPEAKVLSCPMVEGVDCMGFDFGVALAAGDVNVAVERLVEAQERTFGRNRGTRTRSRPAPRQLPGIP